METLGDRIKEAARKVGGLDELADKSGIKRRTLSDYVSGKSEPRVSTLVDIAVVTNVDLNWLLREKYPIGLNSPPSPAPSVQHAPGMVDGFVAIPRLEVRASAGNGRVAIVEDTESEIVAFKEEWLRRLGVNPKSAMIIVAEGDSMADTIGHGDLVLLDRSIDRVVDDGIYVLVYDGMVKLKRVQVLRSGVVLLKSDNPAYLTEEVQSHELPELTIEGRVRWAGGAI